MHFPPVRCLAIALAAAAVLFCAAAVRAQEGPPAAKQAVEGTGVRLIEVSPESAGQKTAAPAVAEEKRAAAKGADEKGKENKEKLSPIPESPPTAPAALEACSFHGVTPGVTSVKEMEKAWGPPKEVRKHGKELVELHAIAPFRGVEVHCTDGKVTAIVIRYEKPFPASGAAQQLDLAKIQPVLVSSELGEVLGEAFPERGVLFSFEPAAAGKASLKVTHIVLEPIGPEAFLLRAETNLDVHPEFALHDLDQALQIQPGSARAQRLRCRALTALGEYEKAAAAAAEAVRLNPRDAQGRMARAQALAEAGMLPQAADEAKKTVELAADLPHVKARAVCLLGDIAASGDKPDYRQANRYHTQAAQLARPFVSSNRPAIRLAAKEVLLDAYLGGAHDVAWGPWQDKEKAVKVWLGEASKWADDLVDHEAGSLEYRFRVASRAMAICIGLRGKWDPTPWMDLALESGKSLIEAADPIRKSHLQWDLGMACYNALQVCQVRSDQAGALRYGQMAAEQLEKGCPQPLSPDNRYLLGRLYFRLGAIHALGDKNHRLAVGWFDKALPLLEPTPPGQRIDLGRHGESLVTMGVSYWETGKQEKAVELSEHGLALMERAAKEGTLPKSALKVPYSNLAAMHRQLGQTAKAAHYEQLAGKGKSTELH